MNVIACVIQTQNILDTTRAIFPLPIEGRKALITLHIQVLPVDEQIKISLA